MAIVQIARITHRKGLKENLPQLAGAELGWAVDTQQLFIGNGTVSEGAPIVGNTEILTENSDILSLAATYTYKGSHVGYTAQTGAFATTAVTRSLQEKLDEYVSVKDFGAVGNGIVDDTAAINRAIFQLFCREINPEIRRSLYFPAGIYRVTNTITLPPYAKLYGDGADSSIIKYYSIDGGSTVVDYVVRTADSQNQIGGNIGSNNAITPTRIEVSSLTFESTQGNNILLIENTTNSYFDSVAFRGGLTQLDVGDAFDNTSCVRISSTTSLRTQQIVFDKCSTSGATYGFFTNFNCAGITISNCQLRTHYKGISFGISPVGGGPTGVRVLHSLFDRIAAQGVEFGNIEYNVTGYNIFLDVGNNFNGDGNPVTPVVEFRRSNNVSVGDVFQRSNFDNRQHKRIQINNTTSIAFDGGRTIKAGSYELDAALNISLRNNTLAPASAFTVTSADTNSFNVEYTIKRNNVIRTGTLRVVVGFAPNSVSYDDEYSETNDVGIVLSVSQAGNTVTVSYTATNTGFDATLTYSIVRFTY